MFIIYIFKIRKKAKSYPFITKKGFWGFGEIGRAHV